MTTSFMALAMFDYINAHPDFGKAKMKLDHFTYYFQLTRSSSNNKVRPAAKKPWQSPHKPKSKSHKGKGAIEPEAEVDRDYYKQWLVCRVHDTSLVSDSMSNNKIKMYVAVKLGCKYYNKGCNLIRRIMNTKGNLSYFCYSCSSVVYAHLILAFSLFSMPYIIFLLSSFMCSSSRSRDFPCYSRPFFYSRRLMQTKSYKKKWESSDDYLSLRSCFQTPPPPNMWRSI